MRCRVKHLRFVRCAFRRGGVASCVLRASWRTAQRCRVRVCGICLYTFGAVLPNDSVGCADLGLRHTEGGELGINAIEALL